MNSEIRKFIEHHIKFYRSEADRYQREADRTLIFIGVIVAVLFALLTTC